MKPLVREAIEITEELGDVIFIGAVSRYLHTKNLRESQDLDFLIETPITDEELINLHYKKDNRNGKEIWYTPRGIKVDLFTTDVSGIPLETAVENSTRIIINKKGQKLRTLGLESLIIAKHRANREQDNEDLYIIAKSKYSEIRWDVLKKIVKNGHEFEQIKVAMDYLVKLP